MTFLFFLLIFLGFIATIFIGGTLINLWRLRTFLKALNASVFMNTLWFHHNGVPVILKQSTPKGIYSLKQINTVPLLGGYAPLFILKIPIHTKELWFIRKIGTTPMDTLANMLSGNRGQNIEIRGQQYKIWAENSVMQVKIINNMDAIASLLESMLSKNINYGGIRAPIDQLLFYNWTIHYTRHISLSGMPEEIHKNPNELLSIVDNLLAILKKIDVTVKLRKSLKQS